MKQYCILFLIPALSFAQLSEKTNEIYKKLSESNRVESAGIGYAGERSSVFELYSDLDKNASDEEIEYMAYHGTPVVKTYVSRTFFERKLNGLDKLFSYYLKHNDSIKVKSGCGGFNSFLADELYENVFWEKDGLKSRIATKKYVDSMRALKYQDELLDQMDQREIRWAETELDSVLMKFEQLILNDSSSTKHLVELIAGVYHYKAKKRPEYYERLAYFEKKYNSEIIKKYLEFCRN